MSSKNGLSSQLVWYLSGFIVFWLFFCIYTFSLRDLNLTLFNTPALQQFQDQLAYIGYFQRPISTLTFLVLCIFLFYYYLKILAKKSIKNIKPIGIVILFIIITGIFAYPAFSHDIFNYLFNAKMILVYGKDPHVITANQFLFDPWTRFMHNVHTAAPYGYGFTITSLIPMIISLPNFTISLWLMKLFISIFFILESILIYKISETLYPGEKIRRVCIFVFNPLLLIETVIVGHNDSLMMAAVLFSIWRLLQKKSTKNMALAIFSWIYSISIKYASVVLLPFLMLIKKVDIFTYGGLAMLLVLMTRPGQLNSWYLHWGIVLLGLSRKSWAIALTLLVSLGGLMRYAPYIFTGNWDAPVQTWRAVILLLPLLLLMSRKVRNYFSIQ